MAFASLGLAVPAASAAPKAETGSYTVELAVKPSYRTGEVGLVELVIFAKRGYKINDKYPTKFTVDPPPSGLAIPQKILRHADGQFNSSRGVLKLKILPSKRGIVTVGGNASFSVCSESACIVGKKHLDVVVRVK
jgi:hypothetical protein